MRPGVQIPTLAELRLNPASLEHLRTLLELHTGRIARAQEYNATIDTETFAAIAYLALERIKELQAFNAASSESRQ